VGTIQASVRLPTHPSLLDMRLIPLASDYLKFRSFIFGTAPKEGNPMFPDGVVYSGVGDEKPTFFRGESGANDSWVLYLPML
jgi:hypothetical protein